MSMSTTAHTRRPARRARMRDCMWENAVGADEAADDAAGEGLVVVGAVVVGAVVGAIVGAIVGVAVLSIAHPVAPIPGHG